MPIRTDQPVVVRPAAHRFFSQLSTAQAALSGYLMGHHGYAGNFRQFERSEAVSQTCFTEPVELEMFPASVMDPIMRREWAEEIEIRFHAYPGERTRYPHPTGIQRLMGSVYEHAFISYFENVHDLIIDHHGDAPAAWPEPINFGRIVRNAFAHGGTIDIRNANAAAVTWRGVTYSAAQNGRQVMYQDLTAGDVTLLMFDVDELI